MDTTERARLRALCEAATPGPWHVDEIGGVTVTTCDPGGRVGEYVAEVVWPIDEDGDEDGNPYAADVALIAASRTAIPALLDDLDAADVRASVAERERDVAVARLSRIEAIRDEARATLGAGQGVCYEGLTDAARRVVRERDDARADVERLRAELAEARLDEREACAALCETLGDAAEQERDACCDDRSRSLHAGRMHGADECARAIRDRGEGGAP